MIKRRVLRKNKKNQRKNSLSEDRVLQGEVNNSKDLIKKHQLKVKIQKVRLVMNTLVLKVKFPIKISFHQLTTIKTLKIVLKNKARTSTIHIYKTKRKIKSYLMMMIQMRMMIMEIKTTDQI